MPTVGEILAAERRRQGKSLADVVDGTKIRGRLLDALEKGRYDDLAHPAYVKGYIQSYARYLEIPATPLLEQFKMESAGTGGVSRPPTATSPKSRRRRSCQTGTRRTRYRATSGIVVAIGAWCSSCVLWASHEPLQERRFRRQHDSADRHRHRHHRVAGSHRVRRRPRRSRPPATELQAADLDPQRPRFLRQGHRGRAERVHRHAPGGREPRVPGRPTPRQLVDRAAERRRRHTRRHDRHRAGDRQRQDHPQGEPVATDPRPSPERTDEDPGVSHGQGRELRHRQSGRHAGGRQRRPADRPPDRAALRPEGHQVRGIARQARGDHPRQSPVGLRGASGDRHPRQ